MRHYIQDKLVSGENIMTINGVDILTSGDLDLSALFQEIGVSPVLFKQNTDVSHTGTTDQTIIATYAVPAGKCQANDIIEFNFRIFGTNNVNTKLFQVYINDVATLTGAQIIATRSFTITQDGGGSIDRTFVLKNSLTSLECLGPTNNFASDRTTNVSTIVNRTKDFSNTVYFIITCTLAFGTDTAGIRSGSAKLIR